MADPVNTGFDPYFGDPLAKFRAALAAQGIQTNIFSGVRDSAKQAALYANRQAELAGQPLPHPEMGYVPRAAVPGTSLHERGLAADIRPSNPADLPKMYALARQYGIQPLGASDPYHFQLGNWQQAEATQAQPTPWDQTNPANVPSRMAMNMEAGAPGAQPGWPATPTPVQTTMFGGLNAGARGMKNNNPGNLVDNAWTQSLPGYKGSDGRFAIFDTPQHGAWALDQNLAHYGTRGINTPLAIASTWAPASDNNNPGSYGAQIAKGLGVGLNDTININDPAIRAKVAQSIGLVENGPGKSPGFAVGLGAPTASATSATPTQVPGPIDPSIIARGGTSPPIPTTPGTTINSNPMASLGGKIGALAGDLKKDLGLDDKAQAPPEAPQAPPAPAARNVSPLLGGAGGVGQGQVSPVYAQRMAALNQPVAWGGGPPGQMYGAGYGPQNQPVYGTSLMSQLQMLSDPTWMNQMAGG